MNKEYSHILFPGRLQPPHKSHIQIINKALDVADRVTVLIYGVEESGIDNPFEGNEIEEMLVNSFENINELENRLQIIYMPFTEIIPDRYKFVDENTWYEKEKSLVIADNEFVTKEYRSKERNNPVMSSVDFVGKNNFEFPQLRGRIFRGLAWLDDERWQNFAAPGTLKFNEKDNRLLNRINQYRNFHIKK